MDRAAVGLLADGHRAALRGGRVRNGGGDVGDDGRRVRAARVQPEVDAGGDHVGAARCRRQSADRGPGRRAAQDGGAGGQHGCRRGQHRVAAVGHLGGAGVVALAGQREVPSAVRQDRRRDRHRMITQQPALLHVQLDETADIGQYRIGAEAGRIDAGGAGGVGQGDAVGVDEPARGVRGQHTGHQPRPETRHAEPAALLLVEHHDRERPPWLKTVALQQRNGVQCGHHAERAVERAAAGHRVQATAGEYRVRTGATPPGPQVAVAVGVHVEAAPGGLLGEPRPQFGVGPVEAVARVAAAPSVPADVGEISQPGHRLAIGMRTFRCEATVSASG